MLYSIVAILVVILDQAVKYWVTNTLFGNDIVNFIPGVISLVNVHNTGAAFGFLSGGGARIYFIVITVVFVLLVIIALATNFISGRVSRWAIVLVAAGGFANCIDRVIYGYVVDMFKVDLFEFAVFNVADIFITVFAIVFALAMIFERQDTDEDDEFYDDEEEEEDAPKRERKPLFNKARKSRDIDEDDEDEPPVQQPARRPRKTNYAQEYEQYKAERAARERANGTSAAAAPSRPAPATKVDNSNNPFAEWEQANERAAAQRSGSYAAKAMNANGPDYSRPAAQTRPTPAAAPAARQSTPVRSSATPAQQPAASKAQPQAAPAPKKQEAKPNSSAEFNLDDILAEFK